MPTTSPFDPQRGQQSALCSGSQTKALFMGGDSCTLLFILRRLGRVKLPRFDRADWAFYNDSQKRSGA